MNQTSCIHRLTFIKNVCDKHCSIRFSLVLVINTCSSFTITWSLTPWGDACVNLSFSQATVKHLCVRTHSCDRCCKFVSIVYAAFLFVKCYMSNKANFLSLTLNCQFLQNRIKRSTHKMLNFLCRFFISHQIIFILFS